MTINAVEVLVVTADPGLLDTVREAVGEQQRIWHAGSADQALEVAMGGRIGVAVIDTLVTAPDSASFCKSLRSQFPGLVLVVAGAAQDQAQLVKFITSGDVYRFLHKPVSTARARQFIEAGVRRHLEERASRPTDEVASSSWLQSPAVAIGGIAAGVVAAVAFLIAALAGGDKEQTKEPPVAQSDVQISARESASVNSTSATPAQASPAPAHAPTSAPTSAPAAAPAAAPARLASNLEEPLEKERSRQNRIERIENGLEQANEQLRLGRLVEPQGDNARSSIAAILAEDPGNTRALQLSRELTEATVAKARQAIATNDFVSAEKWLGHAKSLKASSTLMNAVQGELQIARNEFTRKAQAEQARLAAEKEAADREAAAERERQAFLANAVPATSLQRNKQVQPVYPPAALKQGAEGWVDMEFTVATDGKVKDIQTLNSQPDGVFEQAAHAAVAQWRFKPVMKDGQAVEQRARIRLRFALER